MSVRRLVAMAVSVPVLVSSIGVGVHVSGLHDVAQGLREAEAELVLEAMPLARAHERVQAMRPTLAAFGADGTIDDAERRMLLAELDDVVVAVEAELADGGFGAEDTDVGTARQVLEEAATAWRTAGPAAIATVIDEAGAALADAHSIAMLQTLDVSAEARSTVDDAIRLGLALFGLGAVGLAVALVLLVRCVARPLRELTHRVRSPGRSGVGYDDVTGGPVEVRALARALAELSEAVQVGRGELELQARRDPLTGLANRSAFAERLDSESDDALVLVDLDGFKAINDTCGHAAGDLVLEVVAHRLESLAAPADLVARLGGDEFAIVVAPSRARAEELAHAVVRRLELPIVAEGRFYEVTGSVGWTEGGGRSDEVIHRADLAMYVAKGSGGRCAVGYEPWMSEDAARRDRRRADLREALRRDELQIVLQPVVELRSGRTVGYEALARWNHPRDGLQMASSFIEEIEANGLSDELFRVVATKVGEAADALDRASAAASISWLAVNVPPELLATPEAVGTIESTLADAGLQPSRIVLEVTERTVATASEEARTALDGLRASGIRIAIDDFGAGYSSLASLDELPIDAVKLDGAFLDGVPGDRRRIAAIDAVCNLAEAYGLDLLVEGIEEAEQVGVLIDRGVLLGQGFHLGRPLPVPDVVALLGEGEATTAHRR